METRKVEGGKELCSNYLVDYLLVAGFGVKGETPMHCATDKELFRDAVCWLVLVPGTE